MSILINGLEMPQKDEAYTLRIWGDGRIEMLESCLYTQHGVKAVEVPAPHGRLIDADAIVNALETTLDEVVVEETEEGEEVMDDETYWTIVRALNRIYSAPTVIASDMVREEI